MTFDEENHKIVINKDIQLENTVAINKDVTEKKDVVIDLNDNNITVKPDIGNGKDAIVVDHENESNDFWRWQHYRRKRNGQWRRRQRSQRKRQRDCNGRNDS